MQLLRGDFRINESTHFITEFNVAVVGLSQCGSPTDVACRDAMNRVSTFKIPLNDET